MTEPLYQLVYCSRNTISDATNTLADGVQDILATARRHNAEVGVTGALLFTTSGFAQVLEGPLDAVEATFERIQPDMRHTDVTVLSFLPVERRGFPDWSMAFVSEPAHGATHILETILHRSADVETLTMAGSNVLRLLESVVVYEDNDIVAR